MSATPNPPLQRDAPPASRLRAPELGRWGGLPLPVLGRKGEMILNAVRAVVATVLSMAISTVAYADFVAVGPITSSSC